jgi:hypothetical protein
VLLSNDGLVSVDVDNFFEACHAVAGFHKKFDISIEDWQENSGLLIDINTQKVLGKIDFMCNFWLGPIMHEYEKPFCTLKTQVIKH